MRCGGASVREPYLLTKYPTPYALHHIRVARVVRRMALKGVRTEVWRSLPGSSGLREHPNAKELSGAGGGVCVLRGGASVRERG